MGLKLFLKLLRLFKHHTNILVGANVLDCACAKRWGYVQQGVLCMAKRGLFWRYTTPLVHLIISGITASRLQTAAPFIAAPSVIMVNTCWSVNRLSFYNTCDSWVPETDLATMSILKRRWKVQTCLNSCSDAALQLQEAHVNGRSCGEEYQQPESFRGLQLFSLGEASPSEV